MPGSSVCGGSARSRRPERQCVRTDDADTPSLMQSAILPFFDFLSLVAAPAKSDLEMFDPGSMTNDSPIEDGFIAIAIGDA